MRAVLVLLVAIGLPLSSAAEFVVPIESVKQFVNIRAEADTESDVIGRLYQGDKMSLVQSIEGWHEIQIEPGLKGFISAAWTNVVGATGAQAAGDPDAKEASESADEAAVVEGASQNAAPEPVAAPVPQAPPEEVVEQTGMDEIIAGEAPPRAAGGEVPEPPDGTAEDAAGSAPAALEPASLPAQVEAPPTVQPGSLAGVPGPQGEMGPPGPPGPPGAAAIEGTVNFLAKFTEPTIAGNSQVYDDGRNIGIGTTDPKQRLEVNGSIQIHERNSSIAGLMITQASGETGYIMHNRGSTLTIGAGSVDRITIDDAGNVGLGQARPTQPLEMASGAHVTAGGVWTNKSSRQDKENIADLTVEEALAVVAKLEPVRFNYKIDADDHYVGFIAEDVPEMVASKDRTGLSAMDIVAVLTRVVQEQQARIEELEAEFLR